MSKIRRILKEMKKSERNSKAHNDARDALMSIHADEIQRERDIIAFVKILWSNLRDTELSDHIYETIKRIKNPELLRRAALRYDIGKLRTVVIETLRNIGDDDAAKSLSALHTCLRLEKDSAKNATIALDYLCQMNNPTAVNELVSKLDGNIDRHEKGKILNSLHCLGYSEWKEVYCGGIEEKYRVAVKKGKTIDNKIINYYEDILFVNKEFNNPTNDQRVTAALILLEIEKRRPGSIGAGRIVTVKETMEKYTHTDYVNDGCGLVDDRHTDVNNSGNLDF